MERKGRFFDKTIEFIGVKAINSLINGALQALEKKTSNLSRYDSGERLDSSSKEVMGLFRESLKDFSLFLSDKKSFDDFLIQMVEDGKNTANKFSDDLNNKIKRLWQIIMNGYIELKRLYPSYLINLVDLMTLNLFKRLIKEPDAELFLILLILGLVREDKFSEEISYSSRLKEKAKKIALSIESNEAKKEKPLPLPELIKEILSSELIAFSPSAFGFSQN